MRVRMDGPEDAPVLVLSNSLGTTLEMWDAQVERFAKEWRVLRYDTRGHGGSMVSSGPYSFDQLGGDVVALLHTLQIGRASFCGISMGGFTGLWLGVNAPQRLNHLVVASSAAKIGTDKAGPSVPHWCATNARLPWPSWPRRCPAAGLLRTLWLRSQRRCAAHRVGSLMLCPKAMPAAARRWRRGMRSAIASITITAPTLLIAGVFDPVTMVADAQVMQAAIAGAQLAQVLASHLSNIKAPTEFDSALAVFLGATA